MILGLIGGVDIKKYTVADIMWSKISELSGIKFDFKIFSIKNFADLCRFYWSYSENSDFIGFNVALPWKSEIIKLADFVDSDSKIYESINTVYKKDLNVYASNTDIVGVEQALLKYTELKNKKVLIIGAGGAGLPTSIYLFQKHKCKIFLYDIKDFNVYTPNITKLKNNEDIKKEKYDIIINATPVGKFYLNEVPDKFSLPLSFDLLKEITHNESIIQEMNYFPLNTEIMKFGLLNNLKVISGIEMLVYQALASFKLYTEGYEFEDKNITELINFINNYAINKEYELFR